MKKASYFYIIIFCIAAIISLIYYIFFINFNNGNNSQPPSIAESADEDTAGGAKKDAAESAETAHNNILQKSGYVRDSSVTGYMMKADGDNVNLFEIYENGFSEKIKTLGINPKLLREVDRAELGAGIKRDTYAEICSLIEDFSS